MKIKLHFGILALLLAFLGTYLEQNSAPNQQIVIQFSHTEISTEDTDYAIEAIESKLKSIGVTHIKIGQNNEGQLRITYHSDTDVEHIKTELFNVKDFNLAYESSQTNSTNFPEHKSLKDYELNISEIKSSTDIHWDFEGTQVVELNQKTDRLSYPKTNNSSEHFNIVHSNNSVKIAVFVSGTIVLALDNQSYKIPEVRAGPTS